MKCTQKCVKIIRANHKNYIKCTNYLYVSILFAWKIWSLWKKMYIAAMDLQCMSKDFAKQTLTIQSILTLSHETYINRKLINQEFRWGINRFSLRLYQLDNSQNRESTGLRKHLFSTWKLWLSWWTELSGIQSFLVSTWDNAHQNWRSPIDSS